MLNKIILVQLLFISSLALASDDDLAIKTIINDIKTGWETGSGEPFRKNFLDFDGARYFESGGQNEGLDDLINHHVIGILRY